MYKMKADGVVFYDPASNNMTLQVLSPKAKYELNKAGRLTFTVPPGNVAYDSLHKMKTIITLEQDDEVIFRGRVLETAKDKYNMIDVYCEGDLHFLLDSLQDPVSEEECSPWMLFYKLIMNHNRQLNVASKMFSFGVLDLPSDAESQKEFKTDTYADTLSVIQALLLDEYDGYIRTRYVDGTCYIDYIKEFTHECTQKIEFGVNIVDLEDKVNAQDVFTVLVPLGKRIDDKDTTIESVNNGIIFIEDAAAIAKYGRIVKCHNWDDVEDPEQLLEFGQEYMDEMKAETTMKFKAVDLHAVGADVDAIRLGDKVQLLSTPHGINCKEICSQIDLDIEKPEKSEYTFGLPPESLTKSNAKAIRRLSSAYSHQHRWLTETVNTFEVKVDAVDSKIIMQAETIETLSERLNVCVEDLNTYAVTVNTYAGRVDTIANEVSTQAESISTMATDIETITGRLNLCVEDLNVYAQEVETIAETVETQAKTISMKADRTEIEGFLTVEDSAAIAQALTSKDIFCNSLSANTTVWAELVNTYDLSTSGLTLNGEEVLSSSLTMGDVVSSKVFSPAAIDLAHSHKVTVNDDGTITLGEVSSTGGSFKIADTAYYKNGVSAAHNRGMLEYKPSSVTVTGTRNGSSEYLLTVTLKNVYGNEVITFSNVAFDARDAYDNGYDDAKKDVEVYGGITSITNPQQGYYYASGWAQARIGDEELDYVTFNKAQQFS